MAATDPAFVGWLRIAGPDGTPGEWAATCRDAAWGRCWRLALAAAEDSGARSVEVTVTDGRDPNRDRRPR